MSRAWQRISALTLALAICMAGTTSGWSDDNPEGQTVPVVGLDNDQVPFFMRVPLGNYLEALQEGISAVQDSLIPILANQNDATPLGQTSNHLALQTVAVGLSLTGQVGLGPIWSVSVTPRFRLIFTNSKDPIYQVYN